jgi:hypothetical protein
LEKFLGGLFKFAEKSPAAAAGAAIVNDYEREKSRDIAYHYSTAEGIKGIVESRRLDPSIDGVAGNRALHGDGVHVTRMDLSWRCEAISAELWEADRIVPNLAAFIRVDVSDLPKN